MGVVTSFQRNPIADDSIQKIEYYENLVHQLWNYHLAENSEFSYDSHLKKDFDRTLFKMKRGVSWTDEKVKAYIKKIARFLDNEKYLIFTLVFTSVVEAYPKILEKKQIEIEEIISILFDFDCPKKDYSAIVELYFSPIIQKFFKANHFTSMEKQHIFGESLGDIQNGVPKSYEILLRIKQNTTYQLIQGRTPLFDKTILSIDRFYQKLVSDLQKIEQTSGKKADSFLYEKIQNVLLIKKLPLQEQSRYLTKINELNQRQIPYFVKMANLFDITDVFLIENHTLSKHK